MSRNLLPSVSLPSIPLAALLAGLACAAEAGTISHQSYWDFGFTTHYAAFLPGDPFFPGVYRGAIGQTFTAIDTQITGIEIGLVHPYIFSKPPPSHPLTVTLYEGIGFDGPVLGTASAVPTIYSYPQYGGYGMNPFDLQVAGLTIGATYTYRISAEADEVWATFGGKEDPLYLPDNNRYPGGTAFFGGAPQPDYDLDFIITGETPAVTIAAPASLALLGTALLGIGLIGTRAGRRG